MLFIDLDRLKPVKDALGHATGDLVLTEVADQRLAWAHGHKPVDAPNFSPSVMQQPICCQTPARPSRRARPAQVLSSSAQCRRTGCWAKVA